MGQIEFIFQRMQLRELKCYFRHEFYRGWAVERVIVECFWDFVNILNRLRGKRENYFITRMLCAAQDVAVGDTLRLEQSEHNNKFLEKRSFSLCKLRYFE